ncbi:hypothetical protein ACIQUQ_14550 [Streptomyces sp. NPDC101118]|uniref:hypothetical protein n=1 Tax=Streptomyces sp. NPDC101118 TaxID=3366109 RepID=UPI003814C316
MTTGTDATGAPENADRPPTAPDTEADTGTGTGGGTGSGAGAVAPPDTPGTGAATDAETATPDGGATTRPTVPAQATPRTLDEGRGEDSGGTTGAAAQPTAGTAPATTPAEPAATPATPAAPGRLRRAARRFGAASTTNKLTAVGLALALVPVLTPPVTAAYDSLFGDELSVYARPENDACFSRWMIAPGHEDLSKAVLQASTSSRLLDRWERERSITHFAEVGTQISVRGNSDRPVQLRDITITVLRRDAPLPGSPTPSLNCGGQFDPDVLVVDLDTLPVGRPVPVRHLQTSPQQRAAREAAKSRNSGKEISLPVEITDRTYYNLFAAGRSQAHYTEWRATLTWWDGEEEHQTDIGDDGRPFRVSAAATR